jgi:ATP-dependent Clp protease protease subunit
MSKKNDTPAVVAAPVAAPAKPEEPSTPKNRRVLLFGRLENEVVTPVIQRMMKLNDRDPHKPIDLLINSAGGNGYNADAIIGVMGLISAPVNTICLGHALSGACEILAAGTGKRSAYEFSTLMFHQTLWEADGDITNLEIQAKQGQKFREAQIELLHRCSGQDKKQLRHDIERDHYLSAQEALKYGLIDEIIVHTPAKDRNKRNAQVASKNAQASTKNDKVAVKSGKGANNGKSSTSTKRK